MRLALNVRIRAARGGAAPDVTARSAAARNLIARGLVARGRAARVLVAACVALCAVATAARADVRIRLRDTAGVGAEVTLYLKGSLQRRDVKSLGPKDRGYGMTVINDCARQQFTWIDFVNRRYWVASGGVPAQAFAAFDESQFPPPAAHKFKGTLTEIVTVTDTGERREMFGFTARRLKTVTTWRVEPEGCDTGRARVETDGWYVDLLYGIDCSPDLSGALPRVLIELAGDGCLNKRLLSGEYLFRRQYEGGSRLAFPLSEVTRTYDRRGGFKARTLEVTELSTAPLDDALFAVPAGYARAETKEVGRPSALSRALSIFR